MDVNKIIEEYKKSKKLSFYEKFCNLSYKIFKIPLKKEEIENFEEINKFCNLRIFPGSNISAAILFFLISFVFFIILSFFLPSSISFFIFLLISFLTFLIYYYPFLLSKLIRSSSSSEIMHAIIYMSISLKQTPNLERALIFAASNLHGYLGNDLKRVCGKVLLGEVSCKEGLMEIGGKWYKEAREFSEALKLLISYSENPREEFINEALRIVHEETFERMEKYSRSLKMPSMIILGLGVILPLLSIVVLLLFSIFFPGVLSFSSLVVIYNLLLPTILLGFILTISSSRPLTTSYLLLEDPLEIRFGSLKINVILLSIILSIILFIFPFLDFLSNLSTYEKCATWFSSKFSEIRKPSGLNLNSEQCKEFLKSISFIDGLLPLILFTLPFLLILFRVREVILKREKIEKLEREFGPILYQIGYYLKSGNTLEISILKGIEKFKKFEVRNFFEKIISNLRVYGSLERAIFGENGAIKNYPSSLIKSVFEVIVDVYRKGYIFAGEAMIRLSNYLTSLYKLQEKIEEMISDTVSNLKFISTFLAPLICGTGIALSLILLSTLNASAIAASSFIVENQTEASIPTLPLPFISISNVASIYYGSIIFSLGIYILQIVAISSLFIVNLEKGFEKYYLTYSAIKNCFIAILFYFLTIFVSSFLVYPIITSIIEIGR
jgi:hypothetical protein